MPEEEVKPPGPMHLDLVRRWYMAHEHGGKRGSYQKRGHRQRPPANPILHQSTAMFLADELQALKRNNRE